MNTVYIILALVTLCMSLFSNKIISFFPTSTQPVRTAMTKRHTSFDLVQKDYKTPVFFLSHGGPTFMYPKADFGGDAGAFNKTKSIGNYIRNTLNPDFLVVVSAHWQSNLKDTVEIAVPNLLQLDNKLDALENELIYDFYGFPSHMYKEQFHSLSSMDLAHTIKQTLTENGIKAKLTQRGIDHGVWVPFKPAFTEPNVPDSGTLDVPFPLVQVSLAGSDDFDLQFKLGQILRTFRDKNGVVVCSGMSVHNLGDIGASMQYPKQVVPYAFGFNEVLRNLFKKPSELQGFKTILTNDESKKLFHKSHPTAEHFLPLVVAGGAGEKEEVEELYNNETFSLGWGIYRFGDEPKL
ncbi:BA75_04140T0 [Komagataella pastoris]|uniref:BA75_04140T0 n=1 Tax=Komagataella pastoris TaxID=4922 RepID=A0A1B2JFI8_PICPA|nr:BA75_04140T0 [Komagataella pastoris]